MCYVSLKRKNIFIYSILLLLSNLIVIYFVYLFTETLTSYIYGKFINETKDTIRLCKKIIKTYRHFLQKAQYTMYKYI